jgi:hypothetical protein
LKISCVSINIMVNKDNYLFNLIKNGDVTTACKILVSNSTKSNNDSKNFKLSKLKFKFSRIN